MTPLFELTPDFALLRPAWLLMLPLVWLLCWQLSGTAPSGKRDAGSWAPLIDTHLQPQLLTGTVNAPPAAARRPTPRRLPLVAATLAVLALAGPAHRIENGSAPLLRPALTRLFVVDLSQSFAALPRALQERTRHKLEALLAALPPADSGLVVHDAADAYLVVPPTTDAGSLARWLPELSAGAMPSQPGTQTAGVPAALRLANDVLRRHGGRPEVLWVSASPVDKLVASVAAARETLPGGSTVRILRIADDGSPPAPSTATVVPMRADDADLQALVAGADAKWRTTSDEGGGSSGWRDLGPWLLLALLPLAASFVGAPAAAGGAVRSFALALVVAGSLVASHDADAGADDPRWQAIAAYRAGDYGGAAARFAEHDDAGSHYNRGNALARLGRLQEALAAYDAALAKRPGDADFRHNRDLVAKLLQSPPPQPPSQKPPPPSESAAQQEAQRAAEQWLRRVPDTPPGSDSLLKRKLAIEAERRASVETARSRR